MGKNALVSNDPKHNVFKSSLSTVSLSPRPSQPLRHSALANRRQGGLSHRGTLPLAATRTKHAHVQGRQTPLMLSSRCKRQTNVENGARAGGAEHSGGVSACCVEGRPLCTLFIYCTIIHFPKRFPILAFYV